MSAHIEWLSARFTDVTGSAQPGSFVNDDAENGAAAIRITNQGDGDGVIIEGRPEDLLATAREIVRTAELIVEQTMRDPELRRLYGITTPHVVQVPIHDPAVQEWVKDQRRSGKTDNQIAAEAVASLSQGGTEDQS